MFLGMPIHGAMGASYRHVRQSIQSRGAKDTQVSNILF